MAMKKDKRTFNYIVLLMLAIIIAGWIIVVWS